MLYFLNFTVLFIIISPSFSKVKNNTSGITAELGFQNACLYLTQIISPPVIGIYQKSGSWRKSITCLLKGQYIKLLFVCFGSVGPRDSSATRMYSDTVDHEVVCLFSNLFLSAFPLPITTLPSHPLWEMSLPYVTAKLLYFLFPRAFPSMPPRSLDTFVKHQVRTGTVYSDAWNEPSLRELRTSSLVTDYLMSLLFTCLCLLTQGKEYNLILLCFLYTFPLASAQGELSWMSEVTHPGEQNNVWAVLPHSYTRITTYEAWVCYQIGVICQHHRMPSGSFLSSDSGWLWHMMEYIISSHTMKSWMLISKL